MVEDAPQLLLKLGSRRGCLRHSPHQRGVGQPLREQQAGGAHHTGTMGTSSPHTKCGKETARLWFSWATSPHADRKQETYTIAILGLWGAHGSGYMGLAATTWPHGCSSTRIVTI